MMNDDDWVVVGLANTGRNRNLDGRHGHRLTDRKEPSEAGTPLVELIITINSYYLIISLRCCNQIAMWIAPFVENARFYYLAPMSYPSRCLR
jgi:hypothetical protein